MGLSLTCLKGVGPVRAEKLARLGIHCIYDLLVSVPRGLRRRGDLISLEAAASRIGEEVSVKGVLGPARLLRSGAKRTLTSVDLEHGSAKLRVLFFNQSWMKQRLEELRAQGGEHEIYGKLITSRAGPALAAERIGSREKPLQRPGTVTPVYGLTEGLGQDYLGALIAAGIEQFGAQLEEPLSVSELAELDLPDLMCAVRDLNRPSSNASFLRARRRLCLEVLLAMQASLLLARRDKQRTRARASAWSQGERERLFFALPHVPTRGQRQVIAELLDDLGSGVPMGRLLQGDVGAGKTMVAQCILAAALKAGGQVSLLAPTELLAEQHHANLAPWFAQQGLACDLLSGSLPAARRRATQRRLANGQTQVVIGTHALFSEGIVFRRLDLVVIDEQQRFGVAQKVSLLDKGQAVHVLLMTATPIPRSLALSLYGDLDVSLLSEKPPGRGSLRTHLVETHRRQDMLGFIEQRLAQGERAFWVRPRIDEESQLAPGLASDGVERGEPAPSLSALWHELKDGPLGKHGIEVLHGRMDPEQRARRLERFRSGAARLLLGTTIVEVGVDVPEATLMVIEGAERFGLSQLHQLRGRVGRGGRDSWCFLLGKASARERLAILESTGDGFQIAERDLQQRGMGDLGGLRQAGANVEGLEDPVTDLELVLLARRLVEQRGDLAQRYGAHSRGRLV